MALAETAELAVRISLKDNVSAGVRGLQKNLGGLNRSLAQTGRGFGQIGAGVARAGLVVGGAAIAGITAAAKAAIDFEDAFAGVRKTVDETELAKAGLTFEDLARQFRDMATEIPVAATELAAIGETAGALGIRATDIEEFTRTVALLGVTTDLSTDQAAEALGKVGTILGFTGQDFEDFADILVNLGNKGASVESEIIEITKRFSAAGRQAGLTVPQIAAFSSAIASAGAEPEAAGSSLSRLFGNLITETALATEKGQAFAKVAGKSMKDFAQIVKTDTVGAMISFLQTLKDLDSFEQQKTLKAVGITNVRDRNAILLLSETIDTNLLPALKNANESQGALAIEAQKRFDTIASKLKLFKANILEAGITIGEGFLPALGNATDKLIAFLKVDANKSALKSIGEDIGRAIDGIDWAGVLAGAKQFVEVMKGALSFAKLLFDAFMALPGPIKEATAGFLVLNKLSGGLVAQGAGNVIGGLGGAALQGVAARAPIVGRLFAQPVFVTNWPPGFGGGLLDDVIKNVVKDSVIKTIIASLGIGGTVLAGSAGISFGAVLGNPQFGRSNQLAAQGLNRAEIEAVKYYQGDAQYQQQALKHLGRIPSREDFESGMRKALETAKPAGEVFGPPAPGTQGFTGPRPFAFPEAPGAIEAALERGRKAGFFPSREAGIATYERNMLRAAEAQKAAIQEAKAEAARTTLAVNAGTLALQGISSRIAVQKPPVVDVDVNLSVSATQVTNKTIVIRRSGPTGGSRERSGPLEF
jgi:TP901 family phage tail tape measure protein